MDRSQYGQTRTGSTSVHSTHLPHAVQQRTAAGLPQPGRLGVEDFSDHGKSTSAIPLRGGERDEPSLVFEYSVGGRHQFWFRKVEPNAAELTALSKAGGKFAMVELVSV